MNRVKWYNGDGFFINKGVVIFFAFVEVLNENWFSVECVTEKKNNAKKNTMTANEKEYKKQLRVEWLSDITNPEYR